MRFICHSRCLALGFCAALALGCSSPNSKLTQIQQDKEQLLVAIRDQRDKNRQLEGQVVSLEGRLDEAEKQLARGGSGTRLSSLPDKLQPSKFPSTASPPAPSKTLPPARSDSLPWRAPSGKGAPLPTSGPPKVSGPALQSAAGSLAALAQKESRVRVDSRGGVAQVDAALSFEEQTGALTPGSKRELDQISKLLRGEEGRNLQITVAAAGDAARAQAVADYLDRHGIPQERLHVEAGGSVAPAVARGKGVAGVQILLSEGERPTRR